MQLRNFFTKKKIIIGVIVLFVGGGIGNQIYKSKHDTSNITNDTVKRIDLRRTVLATGEVVSKTDLNLSFQKSGVVTLLKVKVGSVVKKGQVLAILDQKN